MYKKMAIFLTFALAASMSPVKTFANPALEQEVTKHPLTLHQRNTNQFDEILRLLKDIDRKLSLLYEIGGFKDFEQQFMQPYDAHQAN